MNRKPRFNQKVNTTIQRLGIHGEGVGKWHGFTLFIDGALPHEAVSARIIEKKKNYGRGKLVHIDSPSPHRVDPVCPLFGTCGGCQLMHLSYPQQLEMKRQKVSDALQRIGKFEDVEIHPCLASPKPLLYRNKIQMPIREEEGRLAIGFTAANSHRLVEVDFCHIHCSLGQQVYEVVAEELKNSSFSAYNWQSHTGFLRYLIIKSSERTKEALVVIVTSGQHEEGLDSLAEKIMARCHEVKGVVQNINDVPDNVVLGERLLTVKGQGVITEKIADLSFLVSPASFFQVNPEQAEALYQQVLEFASLKGTEKVIDAYCGVGTMSLLLARLCREVVGIESVPSAIKDAQKNAEINDISNVSFICGDAALHLQKEETADVVILNPPRKGCDAEVLQQIARMRPQKVIYVSCDPATLARDGVILRDAGYLFTTAQPFDMFPQTAHVETAALFELSYSE